MWVDVSVGVNVRTGPSTSYAVVGGHAHGTRLTGSLTSNGWLKTGDNRFVHAGNLTTTDPGGGGGGSETVTQWVRSNAANVRSGPGLNYSVVTAVTRGTTVQGTWTSNGWLDIGGGRFISGSVLTSENPDGGDGTETVTRWVSVPVANVRSGPSTSHSVVGTANQGERVQGTLESNGWLRISSSRFMAPSVLTNQQPGPAPAPPPAPSPTRQAILNTAAQYVGYPYILYGTPPNAFDCSSYTWWVYKQNGIDIPRTVRDQRAFVIPVSDPQPGDLVFYHNWYHVGIYAGNGMSYEAQNPSTGVIYGPLWDDAVWYGRVPGM